MAEAEFDLAAPVVDEHGQDLDDARHISAFSRARIVFLHINRIRDATPLCSLHMLEKLDLAHNELRSLPPRASWASLPHLSTLYLHHNRVSTLASLVGLAGCPRLTILTLFGNPVARSERYRPFVVNSLPALQGLDNALVSDDEYLVPTAAGRREPASQRVRTAAHKALPPPQFSPYATVADHLAAAAHERRVVAEKYRDACALLTLQRVTRGHLARRARQRMLRRRSRAACTIQRQAQLFLARVRARRQVRALLSSGRVPGDVVQREGGLVSVAAAHGIELPPSVAKDLSDPVRAQVLRDEGAARWTEDLAAAGMTAAERARHDAARVIQRQWRAYYGAQGVHCSVSALQRAFRGFMARRQAGEAYLYRANDERLLLEPQRASIARQALDLALRHLFAPRRGQLAPVLVRAAAIDAEKQQRVQQASHARAAATVSQTLRLLVAARGSSARDRRERPLRAHPSAEDEEGERFSAAHATQASGASDVHGPSTGPWAVPPKCASPDSGPREDRARVAATVPGVRAVWTEEATQRQRRHRLARRDGAERSRPATAAFPAAQPLHELPSVPLLVATDASDVRESNRALQRRWRRARQARRGARFQRGAARAGGDVRQVGADAEAGAPWEAVDEVGAVVPPDCALRALVPGGDGSTPGPRLGPGEDLAPLSLPAAPPDLADTSDLVDAAAGEDEAASPASRSPRRPPCLDPSTPWEAVAGGVTVQRTAYRVHSRLGHVAWVPGAPRLRRTYASASDRAAHAADVYQRPSRALVARRAADRVRVEPVPRQNARPPRPLDVATQGALAREQASSGASVPVPGPSRPEVAAGGEAASLDLYCSRPTASAPFSPHRLSGASLRRIRSMRYAAGGSECGSLVAGRALAPRAVEGGEEALMAANAETPTRQQQHQHHQHQHQQRGGTAPPAARRAAAFLSASLPGVTLAYEGASTSELDCTGAVRVSRRAANVLACEEARQSALYHQRQWRRALAAAAAAMPADSAAASASSAAAAAVLPAVRRKMVAAMASVGAAEMRVRAALGRHAAAVARLAAVHPLTPEGEARLGSCGHSPSALQQPPGSTAAAPAVRARSGGFAAARHVRALLGPLRPRVVREIARIRAREGRLAAIARQRQRERQRARAAWLWECEEGLLRAARHRWKQRQKEEEEEEAGRGTTAAIRGGESRAEQGAASVAAASQRGVVEEDGATSARKAYQELKKKLERRRILRKRHLQALEEEEEALRGGGTRTAPADSHGAHRAGTISSSLARLGADWGREEEVIVAPHRFLVALRPPTAGALIRTVALLSLDAYMAHFEECGWPPAAANAAVPALPEYPGFRACTAADLTRNGAHPEQRRSEAEHASAQTVSASAECDRLAVPVADHAPPLPPLLRRRAQMLRCWGMSAGELVPRQFLDSLQALRRRAEAEVKQRRAEWWRQRERAIRALGLEPTPAAAAATAAARRGGVTATASGAGDNTDLAVATRGGGVGASLAHVVAAVGAAGGCWPPRAMRLQAVPLLFESDAARVHAAVAIQAAWRAHASRVALSPPLHVLVAQTRAVVCVQRYARNAIARRRAVFLRSLVQYGRMLSASPERTLFIEESAITGADTRNRSLVAGGANAKPRRMPEHTTPFAYTLADEVVVVLRSSFPGEPRRPHHTRVGVPVWSGWALPVAGEERLREAGAPVDPSLQTLVLQGATARRLREPMRVATTRIPVVPPPDRVRRGIYIEGSAPPEGRTLATPRAPDAGLPPSADPAYTGFRGGVRYFRLEQWVNMDWQARGVSLLQVTFSSVAEARRRALLLMQRTFDPSDGTFTVFLTRDMLAQSWLEAPGAVALPSRCASYGVGVPLLRSPSPRPHRRLETPPASPSPRVATDSRCPSSSPRSARVKKGGGWTEDVPALHTATVHRATAEAQATSQQLTNDAVTLRQGAAQAREALRALRASRLPDTARSANAAQTPRVTRPPRGGQGLAASPSRRRVSLQREPSAGSLSVSSRAEAATVGFWGKEEEEEEEEGKEEEEEEDSDRATASCTGPARHAHRRDSASEGWTVTEPPAGGMRWKYSAWEGAAVAASAGVSSRPVAVAASAHAVAPTDLPLPTRPSPTTTATTAAEETGRGEAAAAKRRTDGGGRGGGAPKTGHAPVPPLALPHRASTTGDAFSSSDRSWGQGGAGPVPQPPSKPRPAEGQARRRPQSAAAARRRVAVDIDARDSGSARGASSVQQSAAAGEETLAVQASAQAVPRLPVPSPRAEPLAAAATARLVRVDRTLGGSLAGWRRAAEEAARAESRRQAAAEAHGIRANRKAAEMARQRAAQQVTHEHVRRLSAVHQAMSRTEREQRRRVRVARLTRREEQLRHEARAAERATVLLQRRAQHAADNARLQQQFQARAKEEEARRHAMQKRAHVERARSTQLASERLFAQKLASHHAVDTRQRGSLEHAARLEAGWAQRGDLVAERKRTRRQERAVAQSRRRGEQERHLKAIERYGREVATARQRQQEEQWVRIAQLRQLRLERQAQREARRMAAAAPAPPPAGADARGEAQEAKASRPPPRQPQQRNRPQQHNQPQQPQQQSQQQQLMLPQPQPVTLPLPSAHQVSISRETFAALAGMRDGWSEGWESRADDVESRAAFATGRGLASSPARRANAPSPGAEE